MNPTLYHWFKGIHKLITNSKERKFLRLSLRYGNYGRNKPVEINFLKFKFLVPDALSFIWQFKEIFVEEYYRFETDSKAPIIFDCGANVGTSCAFFKLMYPQSRIIAFEPNPKIVEYLNRNIKNNSLENIEVFEKAVWINNDGIELGLDNADSSSIHLEKNKTKVGTLRLKDLLEKEQTVDMLKMDIEGAEVEVLEDCKGSLANVKNIFVEYHSYSSNSQKLSEIIRVLESSGFRYFILQPENRSQPFINKLNKFNPTMDLQLNIFAYRVK
ncbi:MAG TPA: FkbM family methyltransferase [Ignavibacteriaceae bacterium]|nr:FkbM family methyltransferase [Ignavibacteriaceae bacterium]